MTGIEGFSRLELVSQARRGDDIAWTALMQDHQEAVFRLAYLMVGNAEDAEDIAQETFISAYKNLDKFDDERAVRPWLLAIAANRARNHYRSVGRYVKYVESFARSVMFTAPSAESASAKNEDERTLWSAIKQLKRDDQEIIYLRHFLELSVSETGEALNIASGTVKSRLYRALTRLKEVIESDYPELYPLSQAMKQEE